MSKPMPDLTTIVERLTADSVTGRIRQTVLNSQAYKSGDEMTPSTIRSMTQGKESKKDCANCLAKMVQRDELERIKTGVYKRKVNNNWLSKSWRRRSNQKLGIESYQFGVKV